MRDAVALQRYLQRHAEIGLPTHSFTTAYWHQAVVLPAYREAPDLLQRLARLPAGGGRTLVILVLNRPDSDSDPLANAGLRSALAQSHCSQAARGSVPVYCLNPHTDLCLLDLEILRGPTPRALGVGLARKAGCDLALQWMAAGGISGHWLCSIDADATLPQDYFAKLDTVPPDSVAAVFPFRHVAGTDETCNTATALYELRLHHYVLGLEYAGSPYAYHTLGSCLAIRANTYAHVHGFPKRAGAEDFYLLNKVAKLGAIARLHGHCIELQSRHSSRVPFGTGPAVEAIMGAEQLHDAPLFYHPQCFAALAALLASLQALAKEPGQDIATLLHQQGLDPMLARKTQAVLDRAGIAAALAHCQRQSGSSAQFLRHFHQWFDGFRTLKFIHALRDGGLPSRSLQELDGLVPQLWPPLSSRPSSLSSLQSCSQSSSQPSQRQTQRQPIAADFPGQVDTMRQAIRQHWGWQ